MLRRIRNVLLVSVLALVFALGALGGVLIAGMRGKSPRVLGLVRRSGRAMKKFVLPSAGTPGANVSVIRHVGRKSGRPYETPVQVVVMDERFVIALPYGFEADWLKNVMAAGSATIVHDGTTTAVERPEIVPMSDVGSGFPAKDQRMHRVFGVDQCLVLSRSSAGSDATSLATAGVGEDPGV